MKERFITCLTQTLFCITCFAQAPNKKADRYLAAQMKERQIPGLQLTVMKGNRVIFTASKGFADVAFHVPVSDSTIFSINSTVKIFAGVGLLQLVEAGKVHLDDPAGRYLDSLPQDWQGITNYPLIQKILEKHSRRPYEDWVRKEQFLVAGMQRTFFANSNEIVDNKAPTYSHYYHDPVTGMTTLH